MNAVSTARRLVVKYGKVGAKRKVLHKLFHWTLNSHRDVVKAYLRRDFWVRVGNGVARAH